MKAPKNYDPKPPINIQTKIVSKMIEENQGQSLQEEEAKYHRVKEKYFDLEKWVGEKDEMVSFGESTIPYLKSNAKHNESQNNTLKDMLVHTNEGDTGKFEQPSDTVEYINPDESSRQEEFIVHEIKDNEQSQQKQENEGQDPMSRPEFSRPAAVAFPSSATTESQATTDMGPMPYLYVDVNITDTEMSTIEVYEGDKAETLAKDFAGKHGLDEKTEKKLIEMLKAQMATVLCKIDEEEENETNEDEESVQ